MLWPIQYRISSTTVDDVLTSTLCREHEYNLDVADKIIITIT